MILLLLIHLFLACVAFAIASALIPPIIRIAHRRRFLDYPDDARHAHAAPVPRLGGIAIFVGAGIAVVSTIALDSIAGLHQVTLAPELAGILIGCVIVFALGLFDDLRGVRPAVKILVQTLAAIVAISYGVRVNDFTITGVGHFHLGVLSVPITILWIVGVTNAFNLIDGVDGLAGTFAVIALVTCGIGGWWLNGSTVLLISTALLGAVIAFLRYNRQPARIFLGDSGSLTLGYFLSIRALLSSTDHAHVLNILTPLAALAYPILDTFIAIVRRWLRNHPLSRADGRHVHHQLLALGLSPRRVVEVLAVIFAILAAAGVVLDFSTPQVTATIGILALGMSIVTFFYAARWLQYPEFAEFGISVLRVVLNGRRHMARKLAAKDLASRVSGAQSFEQLGAMLRDGAEELKLLGIELFIGSADFRGPEAQVISPPSMVPFRIDYPIAVERGDGHRSEVVIRLWCSRPVGHQYLGADRVATLIGPAVERWLNENPQAIGTLREHEKTRHRVSDPN